jgi:predicted extracellular nuclease
MRAPLIALAVFFVLASPAFGQSPDIVISQVYGGGGNSGATLTNDYIELFNRGGTTVSIDGWSVQYGSSGGSTWNNRTNLSGTIPPGGYFLIQEAAGAGGTQPLPTPDATGSINMSGTAGKVALVTSTTELACGTDCDSAAGVRDFIGYGGANDSETAPAPGLSNTTAALRDEGGCGDTDDNSADFTAGAPVPRNSLTAAAPCGGPPADAAPSVTGTSPANNAADVPLDGNLTVTFSEPVTLTNAFTLSCTISGDHGVTVTGGPAEFTLDPAGPFARGERCTLTVLAGGVSDVDADDPPDTMAGNATSAFTTIGVEGLRIHDIQGDRHFSDFDDVVVSGVPGVVTARRSNGFYIQDPQPDRDKDTSEGILVFTNGAPPAEAAVGNAVTVSGRVDEFRFPTAPGDLTITEITFPTVTPAGTGSVAPTVVGKGGRIPPDEVIDDDTFGDVDLATRFDPREDGLDFHESLEGMLVQFNDAVAVGPTNGFDETAIVSDGGRYAGPFTRRGGLIVGPRDFNPERFILDDVISPEADANVGDSFSAPIVAVGDYSFGNYKYLHLQTPARVDEGLEREQTERARWDELSVGSFNVENLHPGNPPSKFEAMAVTLVDHMKAPDIVAVEEVQDNNGPTDDGTTAADVTWTRLIEAVEAYGGPEYDYRQIDPVDGQDGGQPGGNIRVGFLFRTDRGLEFVDRGEAGPTDATEVEERGHGARLTLSPGRVEPNEAAWTASRKPLAGEFEWRGRTLFAVANHFASKGGDDPLFGRTQPPVRHTENGPDGRHRQARVLHEFVEDILDADRDARVIVMGDLNDFEFSETLEILEGRDELFNLMETLPRRERYSYVFDGNSQTLDQILVSRSLTRPEPEYDSIHMNAEFAEQTSDHDPQVARLEVTGRRR